MAMLAETTTIQQSRAVLRRVSAGNYELCPACQEHIKFRARNRESKVIANVYVDGVWNRVEHWHRTCYEASEPYGPPEA